ncbi:MAG: hypothetical protein D6760_04725 [Deltaproteobacteria bacterium]|nr:MAG: hypothetical protein D6760_04725 [Deltaproteobacteria bacterium]
MRSEVWLPSLLAILGLAIQLCYVEERAELPDMCRPTLDSAYHDQWAVGIAFGRWEERVERLRHEPFFRAPLYPAFLAGVYRLFGHDRKAALRVQAVLGAITLLLLYRVTRSLFGHACAVVAQLLAIGYWPLTCFNGELLIPVLSIPLDLLVLDLFVRATRSRAVRRWTWVGIATGVSALARPNILVAIPAAAIWILRHGQMRQAARNIAALVCGTMLAITPVTIRNVVRGHDLVWIVWQDGVNFFIGNNPESDGVTAVVPGTRADWWGGYEDAVAWAERAEGRSLRPSKVSRYWWRRGLEFWRQQPKRAVMLMLRKFALLLGNSEISNNRQLMFKKRQSRILRLLPVSFSLLLALAVFGCCGNDRHCAPKPFASPNRADWNLPLWIVMPYAMSIVVFFVTARYRLPMTVTLMPLSAAGAVRAVRSVVSHPRVRLVRDAVVAGTVWSLSGLNPFQIGAAAVWRGYYDLGVDYVDVDLHRARECFDRSIRSNPNYAPAYKMRGYVEERSGDLASALLDYRRALALDGSFVDAAFRMGVVAQKLGRTTEARASYEYVLRLQPEHALALTNLADLSLRSGQCETACDLIRRALALQPDLLNARLGMACCHECRGELEMALSMYRETEQLPEARVRLIRLLVLMGRTREAERELERLERLFPDPERRVNPIMESMVFRR